MSARRQLCVLHVDFERWHNDVISPSLAEVGAIRSLAASSKERLGVWAGSILTRAAGLREDSSAFDGKVVTALPVIDTLRNASRESSPLSGFQGELPGVIEDLPDVVKAVPAGWELMSKSAWAAHRRPCVYDRISKSAWVLSSSGRCAMWGTELTD